jgi:beta-glucosidase
MFDIFSLPDIKFHKDFLFGAGYAGYQVEGDNIHSQWWANEQKGYCEHFSGKACNSYELWETDVNLCVEAGLKAFRTSVEWSRIEPIEGQFCAEALEHYVRFFAALKEKGIKVFATLVHFAVPLWFDKLGTFTNLDNMKYFERYLEYVVPKLAPYVDFWNVINEFNLSGDDFKLASLRYHGLGYHIIKKYSSAPISSAHALVQYMPIRAMDRWDRAMTELNDLKNHEFFFHAIRTGEILYPFKDAVYDPLVKGTADFWSVNSYCRDMVDARKKSSFGKRFDFVKMKMIDKDFYLEEFNPECIVANLTRLCDKPIYITENGCSCNDDRLRIVFIAEYLAAVKEAMRLGADVRGYMYWSLLDNYEWGSYTPTFGLYSVNHRLLLYYGEHSQLQIDSRYGEGTRITIEIPRGYKFDKNYDRG